MAESKKVAEVGAYGAEGLAAEIDGEARRSIQAARSGDDHNGAWKIARERITVLLSLGVVESADDGGALTFEKIVRLAREADLDE